MVMPAPYAEIIQKVFLKELAKDGNVTRACQVAGINRKNVYTRRERDPEFRAQWDECLAGAVDRLEEEAHRRAVKGVVRPIYYQGQPVYRYRSVIGPDGLPERNEDGTEKREVVRDEEGQPVQAVEYQYSDNLLLALLKANHRRKFGDRQEITGADGGPLIAEATDIERAQRIAYLLAAGMQAAAGNAPRIIEHEPEPLPDDDEDLI